MHAPLWRLTRVRPLKQLIDCCTSSGPMPSPNTTHPLSIIFQLSVSTNYKCSEYMHASPVESNFSSVVKALFFLNTKSCKKKGDCFATLSFFSAGLHILRTWQLHSSSSYLYLTNQACQIWKLHLFNHFFLKKNRYFF